MPKFRPSLLVGGYLLIALAIAMMLPMLADVAVNNPHWRDFAVSAAMTLACGSALVLATRGPAFTLGRRDAFLLTTASWLGMAAFAALPFVFIEDIDYADAFFEAISGLTTTGSTVLVGLDRMQPGILLWRSLLQWIGGIGVIVMAILMLPFLRVGGMQLFHTESSEHQSKVVPRPLHLTAYLVAIYLALSIACAIAYMAAGMSAFDAFNHMMTTLATGGYSTHDASLGYYAQPAVHWVGTFFMLAGGMPFFVYIRAVKGQPAALWRDAQVRAYLAILAAAILALTLWLMAARHQGALDALRLAAFNVVSVATTTGYATADYWTWGGLAASLFLFLMFVGGCTGSTGGAIKIFRLQVLFIVVLDQLKRLASPNVVTPRRYNERRLSDDICLSVVVFLAAYVGVIAVVTMGLTLFGLDLTTSFSGAVTAIGNVGPGLGDIIGPAGNFSTLADGAKWLLAAAMLLGRLELFTILVLLAPWFWRD